jgi:hypothetical protein
MTATKLSGASCPDFSALGIRVRLDIPRLSVFIHLQPLKYALPLLYRLELVARIMLANVPCVVCSSPDYMR